MNLFKYFIPIFLFILMFGCNQKDLCIPMKFGNIKVSKFDIDSTYHIYISLLLTNNNSENLIIQTPNDSIGYKEPSSYFIGIVDQDTIFLNEYRMTYYTIPPQESSYLALYCISPEKFRLIPVEQLKEKLSRLEVVYNSPQKEICLVSDKISKEKQVKLLPNNIGMEKAFLLGYYEFQQ